MVRPRGNRPPGHPAFLRSIWQQTAVQRSGRESRSPLSALRHPMIPALALPDAAARCSCVHFCDCTLCHILVVFEEEYRFIQHKALNLVGRAVNSVTHS